MIIILMQYARPCPGRRKNSYFDKPIILLLQPASGISSAFANEDRLLKMNWHTVPSERDGSCALRVLHTTMMNDMDCVDRG